MSKNIEPINNKGQRHGYWEWYYRNGNLWYKCFFHNGKHVGYDELYYWRDNGKLTEKRYYI